MPSATRATSLTTTNGHMPRVIAVANMPFDVRTSAPFPTSSSAVELVRALRLRLRRRRVPRARPRPCPAVMVRGLRATAGVLARFLGVPRGELRPALPGGGPLVGGHRALRPPPARPAPVHLLLGVALHLAQPALARARSGTREHPVRSHLRDGGEPSIIPRHPGALPPLPALQVGVEGRDVPAA